MTVKELCEKLEITAVTLPQGDREIKGVYCCDLLSWVMGRAKADDAWITIMSNINTVAVASLADVSAILLSENAEIEESVVTKAEEQGINVLRTKMTTYEAALALGELLKG